jgi:hypothetical protein
LTVFIINAACTLVLCGVIWVVQVCHYPLFSLIDPPSFVRYERAHQAKISYVVVPLMIAELAAAVILIAFTPSFMRPAAAWLNFSFVAIVWLSTFLIQVPCHRKLSAGFDGRAHGLLVRSNWIRTFSWSAKSLLNLYLIFQLLERYES